MLAKLPLHRSTLFAAADHIEKFGLAKNHRGTAAGPACLHGAIAIALTGDPESDCDDREASELMNAYLRAHGVSSDLLMSKKGCAFWNNRPERTAAEVVTALRAAATWGL